MKNSLLHNTTGRVAWRLSALLVAAAALAACGGGGGDAAPSSGSSSTGTSTTPTTLAYDASTTCALPDFKAVLLQKVNAARAQARSCGATAMPATGALAWNDALFLAAAGHARDMAQQNYFAHVSLDGRTFTERITAAGYVWTAAGENIAAGYASIESVLAGWLASPDHCMNIMNADYAEIGVSCVQQSGTSYGTYWAMDLGRP
jgi:uncharacterized protein YkwD